MRQKPLDGGNAADEAQPGKWPKSRAIGAGIGTVIVPPAAGRSSKENKKARDIIEGNAKDGLTTEGTGEVTERCEEG